MTLQIHRLAPRDTASGDLYLTSPNSGRTYLVAGGKPPVFLLRLGLLLDGLSDWRSQTLDPLMEAADYVAPAGDLPVLSEAHQHRLDIVWSRIQSRIQTEPLRHIGEWVDRSLRAEIGLPRQAALHLAHLLRRKGPDDCLPYSFWQVALLHYFGVPCTLLVGVWIPMAAAHAWVMAHDETGRLVVLGDTIDRVMHYAPTLVFEFDSAGDRWPHVATGKP